MSTSWHLIRLAANVGIAKASFDATLLLSNPGVEADLAQALPVSDQHDVPLAERLDAVAGIIVAQGAHLHAALARAPANAAETGATALFTATAIGASHGQSFQERPERLKARHFFAPEGPPCPSHLLVQCLGGRRNAVARRAQPTIQAAIGHL